jgi:hypothetical protein
MTNQKQQQVLGLAQDDKSKKQKQGLRFAQDDRSEATAGPSLGSG